jgi:predicted metalloprotease
MRWSAGRRSENIEDRQGVKASGDEMSSGERHALSVKQELQADCFAGVWGYHARARQVLEPGDLEEALRAAAAIGDDRLQQQSRGRVVPESFTHGTSAPRTRWFKRGFDSGDPRQCDTFATARPWREAAPGYPLASGSPPSSTQGLLRVSSGSGTPVS